MSQDVFNSDTETPVKETPKNTDIEQKIEELKERGLDELAKGKAHADEFIEYLKTQLAEQKQDIEELRANRTLEQAKELETQKKPIEQEEPTSPVLTPEAIKSLVNEAIVQNTTQEQAKNNIGTVDAEVKKVYGDKAAEFVEKKSVELGLSKADLRDVAAKSPAAFLNLVGLTGSQTPTGQTPTKGTVNLEGMGVQSSGPKSGTYAEFRQMRKENPTLYYSPKVQQRLFAAAKAAADRGEDFYS